MRRLSIQYKRRVKGGSCFIVVITGWVHDIGYAVSMIERCPSLAAPFRALNGNSAEEFKIL
jgi:hypothetical protein